MIHLTNDNELPSKLVNTENVVLAIVSKCACKPHKPTTKWVNGEIEWSCLICKKPC